MKLKVIRTEDTPEKAMHRVVLKHDDGCQEWVRDTQDLTFMLWSNCDQFRSDRIYNPRSKKRVEVESPFVEKLDEDGFGTGEYELRKDIIAFGVDVYDHSGIAFALHGEGGACFSCPWDTARGAFYLYVDKERWDRLCGNCEWRFVDGKPTDELYEAARKIARSEIMEMNLSEDGYWYGYEEQGRFVEEAKVKTTKWDGAVVEDERTSEGWDQLDSCWGFLTDRPARDIDFPLGVPVVTDENHLVGDTFEQECFAISDDETGGFVYLTDDGDSYRLVDEPKLATVMCREYLENNRRRLEEKFKRAFTVVDVTERIWKEYPECIA